MAGRLTIWRWVTLACCKRFTPPDQFPAHAGTRRANRSGFACSNAGVDNARPSIFLISAMKTSDQASNPTSQWQSERSQRLLRACLSIKAAIQRGEQIGRVIHRIARRHNEKRFKSDSSRNLALSAKTMRRLWDDWKRCGESPGAFKLRYHLRTPCIPRPLLIRFVVFCATHRLPSVREAWQRFSKIKVNARQADGISYGQVCYSFTAADFYRMQAELRTIERARAALNGIRLKAIANATARLPIRTPRRRVMCSTTSQSNHAA